MKIPAPALTPRPPMKPQASRPTQASRANSIHPPPTNSSNRTLPFNVSPLSLRHHHRRPNQPPPGPGAHRIRA